MPVIKYSRGVQDAKSRRSLHPVKQLALPSQPGPVAGRGAVRADQAREHSARLASERRFIGRGHRQQGRGGTAGAMRLERTPRSSSKPHAVALVS